MFTPPGSEVAAPRDGWGAASKFTSTSDCISGRSGAERWTEQNQITVCLGLPRRCEEPHERGQINFKENKYEGKKALQ